MPDSNSLVKTIVINSNPDKVWSYLTDREKLGTWYHPAQADLTEGADYSLIGGDNPDSPKPQVWGRVLEMKRPIRLVCTFVIGPFEGRESTVTWDLTPIGDSTMVTVTHDGIAEAVTGNAAPLFAALDKGWDEHFARLRSSAA
ncbi:MAG: SRPBCC domain-containing protein [Boseongicola sp.]|nr:MAG: SRPBCC domain-containing protein [Boseongicola sp.]